MANIEHFIPFLIKWEAGISKKAMKPMSLFFKEQEKQDGLMIPMI